MLKNKEGEFNLIALLTLLFGSVLIVSAVVLNSTDNTSINITFNNILVDIPLLNESTINQSISENTTLINETENLTILIENVTLNESINLTTDNQTYQNETISITLQKKQKNLSQIIEKNKNKINDETEDYLKSIKDKKEVKDYIIKFRSSIDENKLINVTLEKKIDKFKITKIKGEVGDIEDLIEDDEIEFLELEQNVEVLEENIPLNIKKVKANSVWSISNGSGVKVAILDTGIGPHNDLTIADGVSFVDNNYFDSNGHGTSIAGVIAALLNDEGLVGTAPDVSLYSVKIMQSSTGDLSNAISGIEWVIENNMSIVSMSFGFNSYSQIFKEVLQEAYNNNILLVAASGNEGTDNILYPAKYDTVIAVGAIDENNNLASFSSYGFEQELVAPGVEINSTSLVNSYGVSSGTSLAAPHVAGVAALIKSFNKSLTNEQIKAKLRNDALDLGIAGKDNLFGYGLVQINLETSNFTLINLSYFYEIFNITDFGLSNQSYWFWINGTGTVDDVKFMPGYYLVNITFNNGSRKSNIYNVSENGSISILAETIGYYDLFSSDGGTSTDGIGWINENLSVRRTQTGAPVDVECFELGSIVSSGWDYCYAINNAEMIDCDNTFGAIDCNFQTICDSNNNVGVDHPIIPVSSVGSGQTVAEFYWFCDGTTGQKSGTTNIPTWYVVSKKRARCTSTTAYVVEGWYGSDNWITYASGSCATGTICFGTQNLTSKTDLMNNICQLPPAEQSCSGTISAIVTDSKNNPLTTVKVYSNGVFNGSVDNDGNRVINYTNVNCGSSQTVEVRCNDNTVCDSKSSTVDSAGDYDSLSFTCNICINKTDLSISTKDVTIKSQSGKHNITALINVEKVNGTIIIDFRGQNIKNDITQNESKTINVAQYVNQNVSVLWNINNTEFISITVDFTNVVKDELDKSNNYIKKAARPATKAYVDVASDYSILENTIKNYLGQFIEVVSSGQEVNIYIGRKNTNIPKGKQETRENPKQRWELNNNLVSFNSKSEGLPYNGLAVKQNNNIYVFGNEIDGDLAALRKMVDNQEFYFSKSVSSRADYVSEEDLDGLFVFDYLHTDENQPSYRKNSANFGKVVENVLNANVYSLAIKRVLTANDNTSLRLKNMNAELSPKFKNFSNPRPVVLGHGLFGDLFAMEKLGLKIATDQKFQGKYVRDTWLIEYSGGPNTECSNCPNYRYGDLVNYYWPALIGGVLKYSNNNKVDYVGYSAGGGLGLRSYEKYYQGTSTTIGYYLNASGDWVSFTLPANFVNQMALIAPMASFDGTTSFTSLVDTFGTEINQRLSGKTHISRGDLIDELKKVCDWRDVNIECQIAKLIPSSNNISYNFWADIVTEVQNKSNLNPKLSSINRLLIMTASQTDPGSDFVVPENDISYIYTNSNATKKYKGRIYSLLGHRDLPDQSETYDPLLSKFLNNVTYSFYYDKIIYILKED